MNTTIIGVAGGTASGKSTLVKKSCKRRLKEKVSSRFVMIIIIKHMTICLSKNEQKLNYDHPGAFDYRYDD